jgi:hypothetical protein
MTRTTIMLPEGLKLRASERARELGISLGELIRESVERRLATGTSPSEDPLFTAVPIFDGSVPPDLSEEHDLTVSASPM